MVQPKPWGEEMSKTSDQTKKDIPELCGLLVCIHKCLLLSCFCIFSIVIFFSLVYLYNISPTM